jgi:hypothetical protein
LVESLICAGCGLERERLTSLELRERVSRSVLQLREKERGEMRLVGGGLEGFL